MMTSSILRIIFTTWVASCTCCCLPMSVSKTFCFFMSLVPACMQSTPRCGHFCASCAALTAVSSAMGDSPEFSASAMGMSSSASANARMAYCCVPSVSSAALEIAKEHATSAAPPPYTMRLSLTRLRTTHMASWSDRFASSTIIWLPPRTRMVTASLEAQFSITSMRSFVVPNATSRTVPARPSLEASSSEKRGTMRPPVAIAISSSSTPPTHRTAGSSFWSRRWFASSSKPHWQITKFAPQSLTLFTMSRK
mmetsp:Transcript_22521/g.67589  ORF Transcript_22521/g.67589 Transcript_22521/m.67589 type:complete len:252 (-) Transcript_22521:807-1562(-)